MKNYPVLTIAFLIIAFSSCKKDDVKSRENVLYETQFSSDDGRWNLDGLPGVAVSMNNGYYNIQSSPSSNGLDTYLSGNVFTTGQKNAAAEISLKVNRYQTTSNGGAGLIWSKSGSGDTRIIYYFVISPIGGYMIYGYPNGFDKPYVIYVNWTTNSIASAGNFNKLRVELKDGQYHFVLNGREVYNMQAGNGATLDVMGLVAWEGVDVQVDYFKAVTF